MNKLESILLTETAPPRAMKVKFHLRGLNADNLLREHLVSGLQDLNDLIPIAHADILLERQRENTPAYQALVIVAVPGPDIHAAARDHTWPAAWRKVITRLRDQMVGRKSRQIARGKSQTRIHIPVTHRRERGRPVM